MAATKEAERLVSFAEAIMDEAHWLRERADQEEQAQALVIVADALGELESLSAGVDARR
jgi:hypothetical protein